MTRSDSRNPPPSQPVTDPIIVIHNDDASVEERACLEGTDVYGEQWIEVMGAYDPSVTGSTCAMCGATCNAGWKRKRGVSRIYCMEHVFYFGVTFRSIRGQILIGEEKARRPRK